MTESNSDPGLFAPVIGAMTDLAADLVASPRLSDRLRQAGVPLTLQRLAVAHVMLGAPVHLTADEALARARRLMPEISRATVYNTLNLFQDKGLLRAIIVDADRVVFDTTTTPHHHFYDVDTGEVTDVPAGEIKVVGTPTLPPDFAVEDINVVVRIRRR